VKTISFKVSGDEARLIHKQPKHEHLAVSEFLRRRALLPWEGRVPIPRVKCEFTRAEIFGPPSDAPPTTAGAREMLADFP